jgi:hypothetical protein
MQLNNRRWTQINADGKQDNIWLIGHPNHLLVSTSFQEKELSPFSKSAFIGVHLRFELHRFG